MAEECLTMTYRPKYFALYELLPPELYKDEETGWYLLDRKLLFTLDAIREIIGKPLICNTWMQDGNRRDSGYRVPESKVGAQFSQHKQGKAADLLCASYTAEQMRQMIKENENMLPFPIRIEADVNWLHVDVKDRKKGDKIYFFKA